MTGTLNTSGGRIVSSRGKALFGVQRLFFPSGGIRQYAGQLVAGVVARVKCDSLGKTLQRMGNCTLNYGLSAR